MYFITCFEKLPHKNSFDSGSSRCFGYYITFEEADRAVRENRCDIHECLYEYCFIEKIEPGLHAYCDPQKDRQLYQYQFETGEWESIPEPLCLTHIVNWAIG